MLDEPIKHTKRCYSTSPCGHNRLSARQYPGTFEMALYALRTLVSLLYTVDAVKYSNSLITLYDNSAEYESIEEALVKGAVYLEHVFEPYLAAQVDPRLPTPLEVACLAMSLNSISIHPLTAMNWPLPPVQTISVISHIHLTDTLLTAYRILQSHSTRIYSSLGRSTRPFELVWFPYRGRSKPIRALRDKDDSGLRSSVCAYPAGSRHCMGVAEAIPQLESVTYLSVRSIVLPTSTARTIVSRLCLSLARNFNVLWRSCMKVRMGTIRSLELGVNLASMSWTPRAKNSGDAPNVVDSYKSRMVHISSTHLLRGGGRLYSLRIKHPRSFLKEHRKLDELPNWNPVRRDAKSFKSQALSRESPEDSGHSFMKGIRASGTIDQCLKTVHSLDFGAKLGRWGDKTLTEGLETITAVGAISRFLDSRRRHCLLVCNGVWPAFSRMFKLKAVNGYYYELSFEERVWEDPSGSNALHIYHLEKLHFILTRQVISERLLMLQLLMVKACDRALKESVNATIAQYLLPSHEKCVGRSSRIYSGYVTEPEYTHSVDMGTRTCCMCVAGTWNVMDDAGVQERSKDNSSP
ncbi:hypothetical protein BC629DRAFT_1440692 [Irpex lacteus]|nr:hypothetical protein BC629DRAFT_1440692 [Irpex lacteus]